MDTAQILHDLGSIRFNVSFLYDLVEHLNGCAHIKDAQTGKFIYSNYSNAAALKLDSVDHLIGLSAADILSQDCRFYGNLDLNANILSWIDCELANTEKIDHQVKSTKRALQIKHIYFTVGGALQFERSIKFPLQDQKNQKTIAILTYSEDMTSRLGLHKLLQFYQQFYHGKEAIKKFLQHLKIDIYFHPYDLPTLKEIRILCTMRADNSIKYVARAMDTSPATATNHISQLRNKCLQPHYLHEIILKLRSLPTEAGRYAPFI